MMKKGHKKIIDQVNKWEKRHNKVVAPCLKDVLYDTSYPVWFFEHIYEIITSSETDEEKLLHIQKTWFLLSNLPKEKREFRRYFLYKSYNQLKNVALEDFEMLFYLDCYPSSVDIEELRLIYAYIQSLEVEPVTKDGIAYNTVQGTPPDVIAKTVFAHIYWYYDGSFTLDYLRPYCDYIIKTHEGSPKSEAWLTVLSECDRFFKNKICFEEASAANFNYSHIHNIRLDSHWGIILNGLFRDKWNLDFNKTDYICEDYIPEKYRKYIPILKSCSEIYIEASIPSCTLLYRRSNMGFHIGFRYNSKMIFSNEQGERIKQGYNMFQLCLTYSGTILTETKNKWHVLNVKQLSKYVIRCQNADFFDPNYLKFLNLLYEQLLNNQVYAIKDIWQSVKEGDFLVPITFDELLNSHNKKQMMKKYKLPLNFNKADINLSYVIAKSIPYVDEKSANILLNYKDKDMLHRAEINSYTSFGTRTVRKGYGGVKIFLKNYLCEQIVTKSAIKEYEKKHEMNSSEAENELRILCEDYVLTQINHKKKINLKIKSWKKLSAAHDETNRHINMEEYRKNKSIDVKVPKYSKYNNLRTILPPKFEWIKTKKRLFQEAQMQHTCVFDYYKSINKDKCAIYSLWEESEACRYTIEFRINEDGQYVINQMHRACNRGSTKTARSYVKGFLEKGVVPVG